MVFSQLYAYLTNNPTWVLSSVLVSVIVYAMSKTFLRKKQTGSLFTTTCLKPPGPIITDRKTRKQIVKHPFKVGQVPTDLDAIVIGSGPGGLSTAVLLSKAGKKVLVLEQHDRAGGTSHMFTEKGFEFDTGIHYIGDMDGTFTRTLTDQLTDGQLRWDRMDDTFDVVAIVDESKVRHYPRRSGRNNYVQDLIKEFPEEKAAIEKFFDLVYESSDKLTEIATIKFLPNWLVRVAIKTGLNKLFFPGYSNYGSKSLQNVLDELTSNADLKILLSYCFGNYGVAPERAPFGLHAGMTKHYMDGAYYPRGGTRQISMTMIPIIERQGGRVLTKAHVTKILLNERGRAYGVTVNSKLHGDVVIRAPIIISGAGVLNTFKTLLPKEIASNSGIYSVIDKAETSLSYMSVFLGFRGSAEELGVSASNTWAYFHHDISQEMRNMESLSLDEAMDSSPPFLFICFPSTKDTVWQTEHPDKTTGIIIGFAKYEWFEEWQSKRKKHRGEDYNDLKNRLGDKMWQECLQIFPQLEDKLECFNVGSPVTNKDYLGAHRGGLYGLDQASLYEAETAMNLRWKTDIPGLYITGQDTYCAGFVPALMSGVFCASAILNRQLISELIKLHTSQKKVQ